MFSKIVLCANNNRLLAGKWQFGKLLSHQVFQNDMQGHEDFGRYLQKHQGRKVYLLVDAVEEDYRLETMPHTCGSARNEMVSRKLNQIYRGTPYRAAHFINREPLKRKDDRFLFAALTYDELLQPWVNQLQEHQAPLVGIYLLSMVSQHFVRRLKINDPHLLLCERLSCGLRQTYLHNGRLRISRLSPFTEEAKKALGYFYVSETEKTMLYLISQRFIGSDTPLNILIPANQENAQALCRDIEQEQGIHCTKIDLAGLAQRMKLDSVLLRDNPELLHMHLVANGTVPDNLAPKALGKHHQINLMRQSINAASALVLLLGLATAAVFFKNSYDNTTQAGQAELATRHHEQLYQEVAKNFPATPIPAGDLQVAAEMERSIMSNAKLPDRAMQVIGKALSASPEIEINRLAWLLSNEDDPKDGNSSAGTVVTNTAGPAPTAFVPDKNYLYEVVFVDGEIRRFTGDYRAALESVNRLLEHLKADAAVEQVVVQQAPVNVSSYSNLQGSTTDERTTQLSPALFKLRVILKREEPAT
ncbi:MAG: hypothetical protein CVU35_02100 [Betaproteobacteria bacterium HGW-Betaproteobacteria-8]|nr:MAG: hypothetical protein CVU35_02100 [Betaproteobacteria bacterium HGW-Betaproteobacteria-8]